MKLGSLEPKNHIPVYKPIDLHPVRKTPVVGDVPEPAWKVQERQRRNERIWEITKHTAQGCNRPAVAAEPAADVDTSGWDAA